MSVPDSLKPGMLQVFKNFQIGVIVSVLTQPFEVLRTSSIHHFRHVQTSVDFRQLSALVRKLHNLEGYRGFFRGSILGILKNGLGAASFFTGLQYTTNTLTQLYKKDQNKKEESWKDMIIMSGLGFISASVSKVLTTVVSAPFLLLKTRVEVIGTENRTIRQQVRTVWKADGARGFYRGLLPTLLRDVPWSGVQYGIYSILARGRQYIASPTLDKIYVIGSGSLSSVLAIMVTYPFDNLRVRMQIEEGNQHTSMLKTFKQTLNKQGVRGLYKGYLPRVLKKGVSGGLLWFIYENVWNESKSIETKRQLA